MQPVEKVLKLMAETILENDPKYLMRVSDDSVIEATFIFTRVMISKMFEAQVNEGLPLDMRKREAEQAAERIAAMVGYFTRMDKNKIKEKYVD